MKRMLLVLSTAVIFITTLVVPTVVMADGGPGGTGCGTTMCKPLVNVDGGPGGTGCGKTMCKP